MGYGIGAAGEKKIRVVIIDGQNNHNWRATTPWMKKVLEESGRFSVDVSSNLKTGDKPGEIWDNFAMEFEYANGVHMHSYCGQIKRDFSSISDPAGSAPPQPPQPPAQPPQMGQTPT